jgi:DNA-binding transcriptional MerR regulator/predicted transcriptional regulator YdeE
MLVKIGEVANLTGLSHRTLRFWEQSGILKSVRLENGYRYYDPGNMARIAQISFLRRIDVPIADIKRILMSQRLAVLVEVLSAQMSKIDDQVDQLLNLKSIIMSLVSQGEQADTIDSFLGDFELLSKEHSLSISLDEKEKAVMKDHQDFSEVRLIRLPKMTFACARAISKTPEDDCWKIVNEFMVKNDCLNQPGFRHFGFNDPDPQEGKAEYGYQMWVAVNKDTVVEEPMWKIDFDGGLYAGLVTTMDVIGERWKKLWQWSMNNDEYEVDWQPNAFRLCLEECIDIITFSDPSVPFEKKQLDLLTPIKKKL